MEVLGVEHLTKRYGQGKVQVSALDDMSFCVEQGELVTIVGPSGSGESAPLYPLGGMDRPTDGKVCMSDKDMYTLDETALVIPRRRQIGLIYQSYNPIPVLNVEENITLPLLLNNRSVDTQQLDSMVEVLGLKKRLRHLPSQPNDGQQQRVSIGRALTTSPAIVLADEPTGNLDRTSSREIIDLLECLHNELHQTLIIITRDRGVTLQVGQILRIEGDHVAHDEMIRR